MRAYSHAYNNAGVAMTPVNRTSSTIIKKGQWEVTTHRGKEKQVVHLDANDYSVDTIRAAFPKARIKRIV